MSLPEPKLLIFSTKSVTGRLPALCCNSCVCLSHAVEVTFPQATGTLYFQIMEVAFCPCQTRALRGTCPWWPLSSWDMLTLGCGDSMSFGFFFYKQQFLALLLTLPSAPDFPALVMRGTHTGVPHLCTGFSVCWLLLSTTLEEHPHAGSPWTFLNPSLSAEFKSTYLS